MNITRLLIYAGVALILAGLIFRVVPLGKLPGDIVYRRGNFTFYFPLVTMLLINLVLGLVFWFWNRR